MFNKINNAQLDDLSIDELKNYLKLFLNIDNLNDRISDVNNLNTFYNSVSDIFIHNLGLSVKSIFFNFYKIITDAKSLILINESGKKLLDFNTMVEYFDSEDDDTNLKRFLKVYEDIFVQAEFTDIEDIYIIEKNNIVFWIEEYGYFIIQLTENIAQKIIDDNSTILQYSYNCFEQALKRIKIFFEMEKMNQFLTENIDRIGEFELMSRYILSAKEKDVLLKRFYSFLTKKSFNFSEVYILVNNNSHSGLYYFTGDNSYYINQFKLDNNENSVSQQYISDMHNIVSTETKAEEIVMNNSFAYYKSNDNNVVIILYYEKNDKWSLNFNIEKLNFLLWNFDTTFRKILYYERLKALSKRDGLTGIYNHSYLQKKLKEIISDMQEGTYKDKVAALFIDLDDFKAINDKYGHVYGDHILKKVANLLTDIFKKNSLITRYGGDEFVVLLFDYSKEEIEKVIQNRLLAELNNVTDKKEEIKLGVSIGIGFLDAVLDKNNDIILDRIDKAMYNAKQQGKNKFVYA